MKRLSALFQVCALTLVFCAGYGAAWHDRGSVRFIDWALQGMEAWRERRALQSVPVTYGQISSEDLAYAPVNIWNRQRAQDGYTLITGAFGARAFLLDMKGAVMHQWQLPFSKAFEGQTHVAHPVAEERISWFKARMFANGDLLAIYTTGDDTPYGYGMVRLDKDSRPLWTFADHTHHDFDVDENGSIYVLSQRIEQSPPQRLPSLNAPYLADYIVRLSPQGKEQERISLIHAFLKSDYAAFLLSPSQKNPKGDFTHTNSLHILPRSMASAFPQFRPGQVLVSIRNLSTIAVVDFNLRKIVWAAHGVWRQQHSASFLTNGHILLLDNVGRFINQPRSRVLEFDPKTLAMPWIYNGAPGLPFNTSFGGMAQRLANGNTLAVSSMNGHIYEVTPDNEVVWHFEARKQFNTLLPADDDFILQTGLRYSAEEAAFLKVNQK